MGDAVEWWLDAGVGKMTVVGDSGKRETFDIEQLPDGIVVTREDGGDTGARYQFPRPK